MSADEHGVPSFRLANAKWNEHMKVVADYIGWSMGAGDRDRTLEEQTPREPRVETEDRVRGKSRGHADQVGQKEQLLQAVSKLLKTVTPFGDAELNRIHVRLMDVWHSFTHTPCSMRDVLLQEDSKVLQQLVTLMQAQQTSQDRYAVERLAMRIVRDVKEARVNKEALTSVPRHVCVLTREDKDDVWLGDRKTKDVRLEQKSGDGWGEGPNA